MLNKLNQPNNMTEEQQVIESTQKELVKSETFKRLANNPDFIVFRELLENTQTKYRTMLEEQLEDNRSNLLRGGIIAIKDVLSLFDVTVSREKNLLEFLKEIQPNA